jgi:hypothetical protein
MNANATDTSTITPLNNLMFITPPDASMSISVGSTQFALGYYVDPNTREKIAAGNFFNLGTPSTRPKHHSDIIHAIY